MRFFGVNFNLQKICLCKKNDKYEVCGLPALSFSKTVILGMSISRSICSDLCHPAPVFLTSGKTGYIDIMGNNLNPRFETGWKEWDFCVGEG